MLQLYRKGQGKWTRLIAAGGIIALASFGCWSLYNYLMGFPGVRGVEIGTIPGVEVVVNLPFLISIILFAIIAFLSYYFIGYRKKVCDFLIETELEMKKVSWPSASEVFGSSIIVIITVIIFALFAIACDLLLVFLMKRIYSAPPPGS